MSKLKNKKQLSDDISLIETDFNELNNFEEFQLENKIKFYLEKNSESLIFGPIYKISNLNEILDEMNFKKNQKEKNIIKKIINEKIKEYQECLTNFNFCNAEIFIDHERINKTNNENKKSLDDFLKIHNKFVQGKYIYIYIHEI